MIGNTGEIDKFINIKVIGLNTQGLKSNIPYVENLISDYDVIFISEHWLSNAEKSVIENTIIPPQWKLHFSPADKQPMGRPYGGNCFIVNTAKVGKTTVIHEGSNILAIKL